MATNEVFRHADHLSVPVKAGVKSGDPVRVGVLNGVAVTGCGEGGNAADSATVWFSGAFNLEVKGAVKNVGDPIYITDSGLAASGTTVFGAAYGTQAGDGVITVKILQPGTAPAVAA